MPDKILFIDDDRYFARLYKENLQKVYNVVVCYDAETAVQHLQTDPDLVAAVVDVMMPPPEGHEAECHDGNTTGVWILTQCQEVIRNRPIALLLFTNRGVKHVKDEILMLTLNPKITEVRGKNSIPSDELPEAVGAIISRR